MRWCRILFIRNKMNLRFTIDSLKCLIKKVFSLCEDLLRNFKILNPNFIFFYFSPFVFFLFASPLLGQQFYNYEEFFKHPEFIKSRKIKSVIMRVPLMEKDTNSDIFTFQKLGFNPDGQLAWYEHDKQDKRGLKKYYTWHFYDGQSHLYLSKLMERCEGQDSLRELSNYFYDERGHLTHEEHYQMNEINYNDWTVEYEWVNDTVRVRHSEINKKDTTYFDSQGRITGFEENSWKYKIEYDEQGKLKRSSYYWLNAPTVQDNFVDERLYHYNKEGNLERIESDAWEVVFKLDYSGLPTSSSVTDKKSGKNLGWEMVYEFEMR